MPRFPPPLTLPAPDAALAWLDEQVTTQLTTGREIIEALKADPPAKPLDVLHRWNQAQLALGTVASWGSLFSEVHPDEDVRNRADEATQDVQRAYTEITLDAELFAVFSQLDPTSLDDAAARLLEHTLRDFRRSGVDRGEATRERVRQVRERLVEVGQEFGKTIRDDVRSIRLTPERLAGLPQDWIDAHPPDADGLVTVTTDYPDAIPLRTFCADAQARRDLTMATLTVGWPDNDARLRELFALRAELACLLGYPDWPSYDAEVKMIRHGEAIPAFIDEVAEAAAESAERDRQVLLDRLRRDRPEATTIDGADLFFYAEAVRREQFDVDAQQVRRYFDVTRVRQGLLDVTGRLFGLTYTPATDAVVWHEEVTAFDVHRAGTNSTNGTNGTDGERIGRIYLDLHPREGKFKHAAQFDLVRGVSGDHAGTDPLLPEGVLVCNFARGLMEHDEVVTLFHEFGHLLHHVLAGHGPWVDFSGVATEWDFVEAPSQLLEEWAWDPEVLATFAIDAGGEPIPADLVARMRRAEDFGKGYHARTQMFYAAMSYWFHVEQPDDLTARTRELQSRYSVFPYLEGTHMPCSFGHLDGYSSAYYTYMWSLVIAKDLFSAFDRATLFDPDVAARYRDRVLVPGGSRDAADLVADFLGRPYSVTAFRLWLAE
ncbi:MAG: Zn-dependent oligopeptidase [Kineosporiaceae bacterium]|nr:Zn-dependent oligopeptidase [Kineosporiaceae bacterium]